MAPITRIGIQLVRGAFLMSLLVLFVCSVTAQSTDSDALQQAEQLIKQAAKLSEETKYREAIPLVERALSIREKALGTENLLVAQAVFKLADLHEEIGDYAQSRELHQRSLAIREKLVGTQH